MSHYTCLVIGPDPEKQLAPYQENNMGDSPYAVFIDKTDEVLEEWEKLSASERKKYNGLASNYARDYFGYEVRDGQYGIVENPNSKWDWYQLGGRWAGFFKIKPKSIKKYDGVKANFSWGWSKEEKEKVLQDQLVDQATKGDIDFESKMEETRKLSAEVYDYVMNAVKGTAEIIPWSQIIDDEQDKNKDNYIERARERYHKQARVIAVTKLRSKLLKESTSRQLSDVEKEAMWSDSRLEDFNKTREQFIADEAEASIRTFAVVKDGKWFERGKMGWFACVSDEKDEQTWNSIYSNLLRGLPDDTLLSLYDCHI